MTSAAVLTHCGIQLPLSALARLFIMPMLAEIRQDASLFALLLEALQGPLKILVVVDDYFRQILLPPFIDALGVGYGIVGKDSVFCGDTVGLQAFEPLFRAVNPAAT